MSTLDYAVFSPSFSFFSTSTSCLNHLVRRFPGLLVKTETSDKLEDDDTNDAQRRTFRSLKSTSRRVVKPLRHQRRALIVNRMAALTARVQPGPVVVTFHTTVEERAALAAWNAKCDAARPDLSVHAPRLVVSLLTNSAQLEHEEAWKACCGLPWSTLCDSAPTSSTVLPSRVLSSGGLFRKHVAIKRGAALKRGALVKSELKHGHLAKRDPLNTGLAKRARVLERRREDQVSRVVGRGSQATPPSADTPLPVVAPPLQWKCSALNTPAWTLLRSDVAWIRTVLKFDGSARLSIRRTWTLLRFRYLGLLNTTLHAPCPCFKYGE